LVSIRTHNISGLILRHELLFPPPPNFQRGNLLYKLVSSTNLDLNINVQGSYSEKSLQVFRIIFNIFYIYYIFFKDKVVQKKYEYFLSDNKCQKTAKYL
jgi:hypothetical protein